MKVEKLIKELQKLPKGVEVCLFDWRKNVHYADGDGISGEGIYPDFEVDMMQKEFVDGKPFAVISHINNDYDEDGEVLSDDINNFEKGFEDGRSGKITLEGKELPLRST